MLLIPPIRFLQRQLQFSPRVAPYCVDADCGRLVWKNWFHGNDDICKREWLNEISSQYDIKLTKKEKSSVKTKALEYFKNTNVKLAKKINISEGRLIKVFEKAEIADKTEKKMEKDGSSTKEMYIKWKKGNNVTAESQWNNINFKEAIFTLEDVK